MKRILLPVLVCGSWWLFGCEGGGGRNDAGEAGAGEPAASGQRELFNGRDLAGWKAYLTGDEAGLEDVWSVREGLLVCLGEPMGYLYTGESFTDFRLVVEWRWAPGGTPGNSGILMRVNGEHQPLPRSIEVQLKSGNAGDVFGFHGMQVSGPAERLRTVEDHKLGGHLTGVSRMAEAAGVEAEPGEWNRAEVTLQQGNLRVEINGRLVNEVVDCEVIAGPIALQSEGGEVHFRSVSLTPL